MKFVSLRLDSRVPWRLEKRLKFTLTGIFQPKELIPHQELGKAKKMEEFSSKSSRLLIEYGFIKSTAPGYCALLPLENRSRNKLIKIKDEELEDIGCQKVVLPHVSSTKLWAKSGRLKEMGPEMIRFKDRHSKEMILSPTHEESLTKLVSSDMISIRELPLRLYQIGAKFRDEMKPRFGLIRSNEFWMKDLYTFDKDEESALNTYNQVSEAYDRIFTRIGVPFQRVKGDTGNIGGSLSHEFHYPAEIGQDELLWCADCKLGTNTELNTINGEEEQSQVQPKCEACGQDLQMTKGIEVGHTFLLGQKYSKVFKAEYKSLSSKGSLLEMGCYGIGVSRVLAAALEVLSTETELRWPKKLSPFSVAILTPKVGSKEYAGIHLLDDLHDQLNQLFPRDVVVDDREKISIGKKQYEATRTGYPILVIIGKKSSGPDPVLELHITAENTVLELSPAKLIEYLRKINENYII